MENLAANISTHNCLMVEISWMRNYPWMMQNNPSALAFFMDTSQN